MLHELLLSLHGHPSPLLSDNPPQSVTSLCSPTELSLLRSLTTLGTLQSEIRKHCASLSTPQLTKRATIAPAIAAAIIDGPLSAFQRHVRDVEQSILKEDASLVGAYRAVPLALVVAKFDGWERVLEWLRELVMFIQGEADGKAKSKMQSGAEVLDYLRKATRTGYPDIERVCRDLLKIGEAAWVRQLVGWLLYGRLPDTGADDFFIHGALGASANTGFQTKQQLVPAFVTPTAAASILFIGRSIHYVQDHLLRNPDAQMQMDINALRVEHLKQLTAMPIPIVPAALGRTMAAIRISLARNALQKLLPVSTIRHILTVLREFFLLERGEFAIALIGVVDTHLAVRSISTASAGRDPRVLSGALIKEAELSTILNKTWNALTALQPELPDSMDDWEDEVLETARDTLDFRIRKQHGPNPTKETRLFTSENLFDDMLLGVPSVLDMLVSPPLDMFLASSDVQAYAQIHAYLLGLRRTHLHLTGLARLSVLRRTHPAPPGPPISEKMIVATATARKRSLLRTRKLRRSWAIATEATLVLSEMSAYFQGEVVVGSWAAFDAWMSPKYFPQSASGLSEAPSPQLGQTGVGQTEDHDITTSKQRPHSIGRKLDTPASYPYDPATLRSAHRKYLRALAKSLLLDDTTFTRGLREVLVRAEHIVALVHRVAVVVQAMIAAEAISDANDGNEELVVSEHLAKEEESLGERLGEAEEQLKKSLQHLLARMKELDAEQLHQGIADLMIHDGNVGADETAEEGFIGEAGGFVPWKGPGLGRLLMRLEMANVSSFSNESKVP
jgi:Gamma tubulin complex component N-terminal/Gamma tubulin complex component C-terminal